MNTTLFNMIRDINGYNGFGLPFSNFKRSATIITGADTTLTVPSDTTQYLAVFSFEPGTKVWVAVNATAAIPAGASFASTSSELNPVARLVNAADVLHFITDDTSAEVGVCLYGLVSTN